MATQLKLGYRFHNDQLRQMCIRDSVMGLEEKAQEKEPEQEMPQPASSKSKPAPAGLTGREKLIVDSMDGLTHIDVICQNTGLAIGEVLTSLTMLQIRGLVRERGAKYFEII